MVGDGPRPWVSAICVGDPGWVLGSCLWPGLFLSVVSVRVKQWVEDLFLFQMKNEEKNVKYERILRGKGSK